MPTIDLLATCAMIWLGAMAVAIALVVGLTRSARLVADRRRTP